MTLDLSILDKTTKEASYDCLIILNNSFKHWMLSMLIEQTNKIIVTDGAASLLYNSPHRSVTNLYAIIGDMDSLEGEVREYY